MADRYEHFLTAAAKARLLKASEDFHFRVQTIEAPTLLLRHVRTHGQASNEGVVGEAFYALMLSHPPGEFSSTLPLDEAGLQPRVPTLHWHFANRTWINHHRNSTVTYLRLESAGLLRALSDQSIPVAQLARLQGMEAPPDLVQLINGLAPQLATAEIPQITETFLNRLAQEVRKLLGPARSRDANASAHTSRAIEWMLQRLAEPINLQQVASELSLTPRTLQCCFRSQLDLPPMRWLKLARLSQLRQMLWDPDLAQHSVQQLFERCGLANTGLNRSSYREVYGVTPNNQRRRTGEIIRQHQRGREESVHHQFESISSAIEYLQNLNAPRKVDLEEPIISIRILASNPGFDFD